ncbi:uncharacterized protein LOC111887620 [Lactuca sativa]|uniref:uncharacterized protein LOC111887620 n=1 Tax=Lactuca sativa TaxID=4236 RepID=UPI000CD8D790|nr:uncharacterized protein LOC111887620 [Lactuca sativa]
MQQLVFHGDNSILEVLSNPYASITTLLGWFESNSRDLQGHDLTYLDYPKNYKWDKSSKSWGRRVYESSKMVGRLVFVHPTSGELFYLRMLLCHQKGCTSFEDLRTVAGTVYTTFRAACNALRLIGDDIEWLTCFTEASTWANTSQLRSLFYHLLLFCEVSNPLLLWNTACDRMKDDYLHTMRAEVPDKTITSAAGIVEQQLLHDLDDTLRSAVPSKSMADFGLPVPSANVIGVLRNRLLLEEMSYDREGLLKQHNDLLPKLNNDQRPVYNKVVTSIENEKQILIFVYGHGGTGKTFLWTTILSYLRSIGKIVLAVAASGITSLLLPSGTTAHSRFKIPIDLNNKKSCDIKKRTFLGDLMQRTTLIIWDDAPMSDRRCFEFLDRSLRDVLDYDEKLFGGISVLLGGDFRQTLPVLPKSTRSKIIALTLPSSYLWTYFIIQFLHTNMRLESSNTIPHSSMTLSEFATWLLAISNGHIGVLDKDDPRDSNWIQIPSSLLISPSPDSLQTLIDFVYGDGTLNLPTATPLSARAIVCPTNDSTDEINAHVLKMVTTGARVYNNTYTMHPNGKHTSHLEGLYPIEYLNQLSFPRIPPHELLLKVDYLIMLLRNINQREGLCNGTRMIVSQLLPSVIKATIITGTSIRKRVYIPRIKFIHKSSDLPFIFSRKQFPVKVCYAMTINKSQGQSLRKIGIYLSQPVFAHRQLYVALSRATSPDSIKILINSSDTTKNNKTKNVVFKDLLHKVTSTEVYSITACYTFHQRYYFSFYSYALHYFNTFYMFIKFCIFIQISCLPPHISL